MRHPNELAEAFHCADLLFGGTAVIYGGTALFALIAYAINEI
jgi:hypothetical protein